MTLDTLEETMERGRAPKRSCSRSTPPRSAKRSPLRTASPALLTRVARRSASASSTPRQPSPPAEQGHAGPARYPARGLRAPPPRPPLACAVVHGQHGAVRMRGSGGLLGTSLPHGCTDAIYSIATHRHGSSNVWWAHDGKRGAPVEDREPQPVVLLHPASTSRDSGSPIAWTWTSLRGNGLRHATEMLFEALDQVIADDIASAVIPSPDRARRRVLARAVQDPARG